VAFDGTTGKLIKQAATVTVAQGGTGETTRQAALDALAGAVTAGQYLRGDGTDVVMSAIQAADVPTLNQNTTGTAANVTGVIDIANGGTGATSFAAAGLTTLTGAETLTNKTIEFVDGSAAAPSITTSGDTNTGMFFPAADTIAFAEGGVESMRIDSSGNLGLGTTSPAAKFDLVGDYKEGVVTSTTSTAYTISTATGTLQILTLTNNCTFTFPTAVAGESFTLLLRQDGTGGRTATWPANVRWPGGTSPTITATASRQDKYVFTADGTNWYGSNAGQNYTV
jgi:hypothetical protein